MRSIGRLFQPQAVAATDLATAETDPGSRELSRISADGRWWWDGERWLATSTPDGLWRWDGDAWRPTIELAGVRARDLATTLALLAEDRYARAAAILVERAREWRPQGEPRDLVARASGIRRRLVQVHHAFATAASGPSGLVRRLRAAPEDRERLEEERGSLDTEYRAVLVRLGRLAPRPTVKEADDLLEVARLLDRRATRITRALTTADEAERARARAIEAARHELHAAEAARREALDAAARQVARAGEARDDEREHARRRLREALAPEPERPLAEVGALRLYPALVETPAGRLAAAGLRATAGRAGVLWRQHRELLQDLVLLETPDAEAFLRCLTERRHDQFLLLEAGSRLALWRCPAGEEKPLRRFLTAVNRQGEAARELVASRADEAARLWAELTRGEGSRLAMARQALARLESDPELDRPVEEARRRLAEARGEPPELLAAREAVAEELHAVTTPPAPLAAADREAAQPHARSSSSGR